jgi:large repetitive protein
VNTTTTGVQRDPVVVALRDGSHVVAWYSASIDNFGIPLPGSVSVCSQRYAADGAALGGEVCITTDLVNSRRPAVAALADGGYVIAWALLVKGGVGGIRAQRYDANGAAVSGVQQVNTDTGPDLQEHMDAAGLAGGGYVLTWVRTGQTSLTVMVRRYGADGVPTNPEQTVGSGDSSVAALSGGGYVILRSADFGATFAARYDDQGSPVGQEVPVFGEGLGAQPAIASLASGGYAVVWQSLPSGALVVQRFAADGTPLGTAMPVDSPVQINNCFKNVPCPNFQGYPAIVELADGGYVVGWLADTPSTFATFARRFAADGAPLGPVTPISTGGGSMPSVASISGGRFVITWSGFAGVNDSDVFERRFDAQGLLSGTAP